MPTGVYPRPPAVDRLMAKVGTSAGLLGCWPWTGATSRFGYGIAWWNGHTMQAHRAVWIALRGPLSDDLTLDHGCRTKLCVNPACMEPVTLAENIR